MPDADVGAKLATTRIDLTHERARQQGRHRNGARRRKRAGLVALKDTDHTDADVHVRRIHPSAGNIGVALGRRHETHLWHGRAVGRGIGKIVCKPHAHTGCATYLLENLAGPLVGVDLLGQHGTRKPDVTRAHDNERVGDVKDGRLDFAKRGHLEGLPNLACGQQRPGLGPGWVQELDEQLGSHAVDAGNGAISVLGEAVRLGINWHRDVDVLVGVSVEHVYAGDGLDRNDQPLLDRKRPHGCRHVAAVGLEVHLLLAHDDLANLIFDVDTGLTALPYDDNLVVGQDAAAHSVDLLGVGVTHDLKKDVVPLRLVCGQVLPQEHTALGRASAHEHRPELAHSHPF